MRHLILASLVVLPVMAHAQSSTAANLSGATHFSMKAGIPQPSSSAARLTTAVEVGLTPEELSSEPAVSKVVLRAIVDENGIPRNVAISQSAGKVVDAKAIAAVSQYRFQPAMMDNRPTWSSVSISIRIEKP